MISQLGRYNIIGELGQGAMGTVYKAVDPLIDRIVAIKTINLTLALDEKDEYESRFYQEAKAAGRLSHPNIVTIYDVGKSGEIAYIAMEFLQGQDHVGHAQAAAPLLAAARLARADFDHRQAAPLQRARGLALVVGSEHAFQADALAVQGLVVVAGHRGIRCRSRAALPRPWSGPATP